MWKAKNNGNKRIRLKRMIEQGFSVDAHTPDSLLQTDFLSFLIATGEHEAILELEQASKESDEKVREQKLQSILSKWSI